MLNSHRRRRIINALIPSSELVNVLGVDFKRFYYGKGAATTEQANRMYTDLLSLGGTILPYTSDTLNKPVGQSEVNVYSHALIRTWNQTWKNLYGDWFILPNYDKSLVLNFNTPFSVLCSDGVVRKIYNYKIGWNGSDGTTITKDDVISFWDAAGISPTAGGKQVPASVSTAWYNDVSRSDRSHFDHTNKIDISLGNSEDPFFTGKDFFKFNFTAAAALNTVVPATAGIGSLKWLNVTNLAKATGKFGFVNRAVQSPGQAYAEIQNVFDSNPNKWTLCARIRVNNLDKNRLLSVFDASNKEVCSINMVGVGGSDVGPVWPFYINGVEKGIKFAGAPRTNVNNWLELMAVKDGNIITLFINGVQAATASSAEHAIPSNARFVLFGGPGGVGNIANTQIEMLHIWPGYAAPADRAGLVNWMPY